MPRLYAVKDQVSDEFGPIFEAKSDAVAIRATRQMLINVRDVFIQDYSLMYLGEFKDNKLVPSDVGPLKIEYLDSKIEVEVKDE